MDERIIAIVTVESTSGGSLAIRACPVDPNERYVADQATIAFSIRREGDDVIRLSMRHDESGSVVYLQGGAPLLEFARQLGFHLERSAS